MGEGAAIGSWVSGLPLWFPAGGFTLLGLIIGSFLATLCIRWPEGRSAIGGRSACDSCGRVLGLAELVPVVSALAMRGRCRVCGAPIARMHLRIELVAGLLGLLPFLLLPPGAAVGWAVLGWLLIPLAVLDWRELWLPNALVLLFALAGLVCGPLLTLASWSDRVIGAAAGFVALFVIGEAYRLLRGREGLGAGDAKLLGALGIWFGWQGLPLLLLAASAIGIAVALVLQLTRGGIDRTTALPFGTSLAIAAWLMPVLQLVGLGL